MCGSSEHNDIHVILSQVIAGHEPCQVPHDFSRERVRTSLSPLRSILQGKTRTFAGFTISLRTGEQLSRTKQCSASSVESHFSDGFDRNFYNRVWLQESNANALAEFHLMEGIKSDDFNGRLSQLRSAAEKFKLQNEPHAR